MTVRFRLRFSLADFWCRWMHTKAMWPIHGKYICPQCLREFPAFPCEDLKDQIRSLPVAASAVRAEEART